MRAPKCIILRTMAVSDGYLDYVLEQLSGLGRVVPRRMFGGVGLYLGERFFGLVFRDTLYLKTDDSNRSDYETRGMDRFRPFPDKPQLSMTYYAAPADILEDAEECTVWARKSVAAASLPKAAARRRKKRAR